MCMHAEWWRHWSFESAVCLPVCHVRAAHVLRYIFSEFDRIFLSFKLLLPSFWICWPLRSISFTMIQFSSIIVPYIENWFAARGQFLSSNTTRHRSRVFAIYHAQKIFLSFRCSLLRSAERKREKEIDRHAPCLIKIANWVQNAMLRIIFWTICVEMPKVVVFLSAIIC